MPVSPVGGTPQPPPADKSKGPDAQDAIAMRVFAMLMSIMGANYKMLMKTLIPELTTDHNWEAAASGIYAIFSVNPGTAAGKWKDSQLTNAEMNMFANGWQRLQALYKNRNTPAGKKAWEKVPKEYQAWVKNIMTDPTLHAGLQKVFEAVKKLQKLENEGASKKDIATQRNAVLADVSAFQKLGKSKDPKVAANFKAAESQTRTVQQAMSTLTQIAYALAMRVVNQVVSIEKYTTQQIQQLESIKSRMIRGTLP